MKTIINRALFVIFTLGIGVNTNSLLAAVPAGQDELRIHTGVPQKEGESIVSISVYWRMKDGLITGSTGLAFIKGPNLPKPDDANSIARRIGNALISGMAYKRPSLRGLTANTTKDAENPYVTIKNKQGISFSQITLRDFTNQKFAVEIDGSSFSAKGVSIAIDMADYASVANVVINESTAKKTFRADGGGIEISIGNEKSVKIDTRNKTLPDIERVLAAKLRGTFSTSALYPARTEKRDKKNIKPFDGGEVHLGRISVKKITIDVNDPSLGVITKFKFQNNENQNKKSSWW